MYQANLHIFGQVGFLNNSSLRKKRAFIVVEATNTNDWSRDKSFVLTTSLTYRESQVELGEHIDNLAIGNLQKQRKVYFIYSLKNN